MTATFTPVRLDFHPFISTKSLILFYHGLLVICSKHFSFFPSFAHVKSTPKTFERNTPPSCKCAYQSVRSDCSASTTVRRKFLLRSVNFLFSQKISLPKFFNFLSNLLARNNILAITKQQNVGL